MEIDKDVVELIAVDAARKATDTMEERVNKRIDTMETNVTAKIDELSTTVKEGYVSCASFDQFHADAHKAMGDKKLNKWNVVLGVGASLVVLMSAFFGIINFLERHMHVITKGP